MSAEPIFNYLLAMGEHNASDLYLTVGSPPLLRTSDMQISIVDELITPDQINEIIASILTPRQRHEYDANWELNTSIDMGEQGRFRVNVLKQRQFPALVIRRIVTKIPSFTDLKLPAIYSDIVMAKRGLVLVVGMTGSGKSTSLASMIDRRNSIEKGHIITIEDPIEYYHEHKQSVITQREIGVDTHSYSAALKNALRQRPDVILVGEIRDREVMEQSVMASETGHLCLATIHGSNAYQAIERVINLFPEDQVQQVRMSLSMNLNAILSQRLVPSLNGGLVPVLEIMLNQGLVRELILKGDVSKIKDVMEDNTMMGMRTFDQSLLQLYKNNEISEETLIANADRPTEMQVKLQQANLEVQENSSDTESALLKNIDTSFLVLKD